MAEHVGLSSRTSTPLTCTPSWHRAGGCSTTRSRVGPDPRVTPRETRPRSSTATSSPTASCILCRRRSTCWSQRGSRSVTWSRCVSTTRTPCVHGWPTLNRTGTGRSGSPAQAAPGCGGCTWPARHSDSSPTASASTGPRRQARPRWGQRLPGPALDCSGSPNRANREIHTGPGMAPRREPRAPWKKVLGSPRAPGRRAGRSRRCGTPPPVDLPNLGILWR